MPIIVKPSADPDRLKLLLDFRTPFAPRRDFAIIPAGNATCSPQLARIVGPGYSTDKAVYSNQDGRSVTQGMGQPHL
jgi:hypothetical protein